MLSQQERARARALSFVLDCRVSVVRAPARVGGRNQTETTTADGEFRNQGLLARPLEVDPVNPRGTFLPFIPAEVPSVAACPPPPPSCYCLCAGGSWRARAGLGIRSPG